MLLHNGILLGRKYVVEGFVGQGAFGEVYRVRHEFLGVLAMKVFKYAGVARDELLASMGEPRRLSELKHPNIIGVHDADIFTREDLRGAGAESDVAEGRQYGYYTMDYVPTNLEAYWKSFRNRFMPVLEAGDIVRQVCQGLAIAHGMSPPVVHRDIKPQNILVRRLAGSLNACLTDFGLAKQVDAMSLAASLRGAPLFKPPEAVRDRVDSTASDIWAVGVTFYILLTDQLPLGLTADSIPQVDYDQPVQRPSLHNAGVPAELDEIVLTALEKDPDQRYQDAREMHEALRDWMASAQLPSPKDGTASARIPSRKNRIGRLPLSGGAKIPEGALQPANRAALSAAVRHRPAEQLRKEALALARSSPADLSRAADLLEEAIRGLPDIESRLSNCLRLWRMGIYTPFASHDTDDRAGQP